MKPTELLVRANSTTCREVVYAKNQPEYIPLPALLEPNGTVHTRWGLSLRERLYVLFHGAVYLSVLTFNCPLQPTRMAVKLDTRLVQK